MADLGYQEGRNVRYDVRYRTASKETIEQFARELAAAKVDLIWALGSAAAAAAQKVTASIPIVFALAADAVSAGLVRSLAAPGTNATGITMMTSELAAKRLEILGEIFPKARRVGVLHNLGDSASVAQLPFVQNAAQTLGKELMVVEARAPEEFAAAFVQLKRWRAEAFQILANTLFFTHRKVLLDAAAENRWVTVNSSKEYAEAGGVAALRRGLRGQLPAQRRLRGQDTQGRQAGRAAGAATGQIRVRDQPQEREGDGVNDPAVGAAARR